MEPSTKETARGTSRVAGIINSCRGNAGGELTFEDAGNMHSKRERGKRFWPIPTEVDPEKSMEMRKALMLAGEALMLAALCVKGGRREVEFPRILSWVGNSGLSYF